MKAELNFVISSAHIFTSVTGFFQNEEPLIHLLHSVLSSLVMKLLGRICKSEILKDLDLKKIDAAFFNTKYLLPLKEIQFSDEVLRNLENVCEKDKTFFCLQAQKHFVESVKHVVVNKSSKSSSCLLYTSPSPRDS